MVAWPKVYVDMVPYDQELYDKIIKVVGSVTGGVSNPTVDEKEKIVLIAKEIRDILKDYNKSMWVSIKLNMPSFDYPIFTYVKSEDGSYDDYENLEKVTDFLSKESSKLEDTYYYLYNMSREFHGAIEYRNDNMLVSLLEKLRRAYEQE